MLQVVARNCVSGKRFGSRQMLEMGAMELLVTMAM